MSPSLTSLQHATHVVSCLTGYQVSHSVICKLTSPRVSLLCAQLVDKMCVVSWKRVAINKHVLTTYQGHSDDINQKPESRRPTGSGTPSGCLGVSLRWSKSVGFYSPGVSTDSSFLYLYELLVSLLMWCCRAKVSKWRAKRQKMRILLAK